MMDRLGRATIEQLTRQVCIHRTVTLTSFVVVDVQIIGTMIRTRALPM